MTRKRTRAFIDPTKILSVKDGMLYLGDVAATETQLKAWKSDAELLGRINLWPFIMETTRKYLMDKGINESQSWEHVLAVKGGLALLDWQEAWIRTVRSAKTK